METATLRHDTSKNDKHDEQGTPKRHTGKNAKSTANNTKRGAVNTKAPFTMKDPRKDTANQSAGDDGSEGEAADNRKEADFGKPTGSHKARALNLHAARRPAPRRPGDRTGRRRVRR
ncbi:MAG: hypothetical protein KC486_24220 [Myxococcales bacterium]|nr:hypothetical protein [Myxococcales bacterium]